VPDFGVSSLSQNPLRAFRRRYWNTRLNITTTLATTCLSRAEKDTSVCSGRLSASLQAFSALSIPARRPRRRVRRKRQERIQSPVPFRASHGAEVWIHSEVLGRRGSALRLTVFDSAPRSGGQGDRRLFARRIKRTQHWLRNPTWPALFCVGTFSRAVRKK
jgi:hypothetical protein